MNIENKESAVRNKFTLITFVCSVFVVFIHCFNLETYGISENSTDVIERITFAVEDYWPNVLHIAVPMFFMVSGLLFFRTFSIQELLKKWKTRLFTILLPYIIWCTIYYLYMVALTNIPFIKALMNSTTIVEFSIIEWLKWLWISKYYTLWFLQELIIYIVAAPLIWLLINNHWKKAPTGIIALISIIVFLELTPVEIPYTTGLEVYLIGAYIGLNCRKHIMIKNRIISIVSLIYIVFTLVTAFRFWNIATEALLFFAIWFACDMIPLEDKRLPWWMSISFFIYVAHDALLEAIEKVILVVFGKHAIFALLDYILTPLIVELILILVAYVLRRWLPIIWRVLTGDRGSVVH